MTYIIQRRSNASKKQTLAGISAVCAVLGGALLVSQNVVLAETNQNQTAGGFDLTKQATSATYPLMFDRPSGVNAAALAGAVRNLGTDSEIYKAAVKVVPELADQTKMSTLLSNAMSSDATKKAEARTTIVKLINWYNSLGGTKITTQSGAAYTVDNLDQPINVLAVAFSNNGTINSRVSSTITDTFKNVKTVQDVMNIFKDYDANSVAQYQKAFDTYAALVKSNPTEAVKYENMLPVLNAYEKMYADGGSAIRRELLKGSASSTEAAVAFFESAVVTGRIDNNDNGGSNNTTPDQKEVTTRWILEDGTELTKSEKGKEYKEQRTFPDTEFVRQETKDSVRTYIYKKVQKPTPTPKKVVTKYVYEDKTGKRTNIINDITAETYQEQKTFDGYKFEKVENGDGVRTYVYSKPDPKPDPTPQVKYTYWFDDQGNELSRDLDKKHKVEGTFPDTDKNDVKGYDFVRTVTVTAEIMKTEAFKKSGFKEGDTINIYKKQATPTPTPKVTEDTVWMLDDGKTVLKPKISGTFPDNDGKSDIEGHTIVSTNTTTDKDGNKHTVNVYHKPVADTIWLEEGTNKVLKPKTSGSFIDNDGKSDIVGYQFRSYKQIRDKNGDIHTINYYRLTPKQVTTHWGFENDRDHFKKQTGEDFGKEESYDGYKLVKVETSKDGKDKYYIYEPIKKEEPKKPEESPKETPKKPTPQKSLPKTGGASEALTQLVGLVAASGGVAGVALRRKKKEDE